MRVVVTGATGNVGTSVVSALAADPNVTSIVGLARRAPDWDPPKTEFLAADITRAPLADLFEGADAVVHLAWLIQPSRDATALEAVNVHGSRLVFEAAAAAGVSALVHASSVGAYGPGPSSGGRVDESWPTDGIPSSFYARHKAQAERALDAIEATAPGLRVVRLRPGLIFKREAASEIRRLFAGPLLPGALANPRLIPALPLPRGLRVQAVHGADVAEAYRLAVTDERARGAYNVVAEPVLDAGHARPRARRAPGRAAAGRGSRADRRELAPARPADARRLARPRAAEPAAGRRPHPVGARVGAGHERDRRVAGAARGAARRRRRPDPAARRRRRRPGADPRAADRRRGAQPLTRAKIGRISRCPGGGDSGSVAS